jgi:putative ABC transport system substrate-binding protein
MTISIGRRHFISALGGAVVAWPLAAQAQQPAKLPLLGYLTADSPTADLPRRTALQQGLHELGYNEGKNIVVEYRVAAGSIDKLAEYAADLSQSNVDIVFAFTFSATAAAAKAMPAKPIVSITPDPVSLGLVASLSRPGGNITGLTTLAGTEIYRKYFELLKDMLPDLTRVAFLANPTNPLSALALREAEAAAPVLGLSMQLVEARSPDELETAFGEATKAHAGGLVVMQDPMFLAQRAELAALAAAIRIPAIYGILEHAVAGGLMAYAASRPEIFRRAATFIDKILKGARPAELPVEQPTKFELIINLKTAKALGLKVPQTVLSRADEVIE